MEHTISYHVAHSVHIHPATRVLVELRPVVDGANSQRDGSVEKKKSDVETYRSSHYCMYHQIPKSDAGKRDGGRVSPLPHGVRLFNRDPSDCHMIIRDHSLAIDKPQSSQSLAEIRKQK